MTYRLSGARDGNRTRTSVAGNRILSPARLPVPPPGQHHHPKNKKFHRQTTNGIPGAEDEARTRDLNLGKVALYQLSYFRMNIRLKELSLPHNPNTRILNGAAKIRYRRISEKSFFAVCTRGAPVICTGGYTAYYRELRHPVCPCNDVRINRMRPQTETLQYKTLPDRTGIRTNRPNWLQNLSISGLSIRSVGLLYVDP
jgi:hypothetical protein